MTSSAYEWMASIGDESVSIQQTKYLGLLNNFSFKLLPLSFKNVLGEYKSYTHSSYKEKETRFIASNISKTKP